jgi:multicomponent K+:H+ antiporter subunit E
MRRWLPYPLLSLSIFTMWLLLNQSLTASHLVVALALAFGGGLMVVALEPPRARLRRPRAMAKLAFLVLHDIVRSNIAVARIILGPRLAGEISGFVRIPLDLRNPYGLAVLAIIITATPGTLWVDYDSPTGVLTIHVLDLVDENTWIETIKRRYERLLREIFE